MPGIDIGSKSRLGYPHLDKTTSLTQGFFMEFFGTFYLVFAFYACSIHRKASPGVCAAIVGASLFTGIVAFGSTTGGGLNPARTFGPSIIAHQFMMRGWWIYYAATTLGGVVAAYVYKFIISSENSEYDSLPNVDLEGRTNDMEM